MWKKLCITACVVLCAALFVVPAVFADDTPAESSASSSTSESTISDDAGNLNSSVTGNFSDGVDGLKDSFQDAHGSWEKMDNTFSQFIKQALTFVPENYWFAFSLSILFGFLLALYRRMA